VIYKLEHEGLTSFAFSLTNVLHTDLNLAGILAADVFFYAILFSFLRCIIRALI